MVDKIELGIPFFDERMGGVYRGRQVLCVGRRQSGKSLLAYRFAAQGIRGDERVLLLSDMSAKDVLIVAESFGLGFSEAVRREQLMVLEYAGLLGTGGGTAGNLMLPPDAFMELQDIIEAQSISRVVFDTVLPWVAIEPVSRLQEHVYSFMHALDRLGVTALMTLPKPVSASAFTLKKYLEDIAPVSLSLDCSDSGDRVLRVVKYLGESSGFAGGFNFEIVSGIGFRLKGAGSESPKKDTPEPPSSPLGPLGGSDQPRRAVRFSDVINT